MTKRIVRKSVAALVGAALFVTACGGSDGAEQEDDVGADVQTVRADLERRSPSPEAPVDEVVAGLHGFTLELAAQGDPTENLVLSPTSIAVAFAMAQAGAGDETASQIAEVFGFPAQPGVHEAMNTLTAAFESANHSGDEGDEVILELANAVWGQQDTEIGQEFLDTLATEYGAGLQATDFRGDPTGSREVINGWVSEATRERIPDLIPEGMITPRTVAMLVNAIYLKAAWASEFSEDATEDRPFHLPDGSTVDVPTMSQSMLDTRASQGDGYSAVELPYVGGELAMTVVVPDEATSLSDFEGSLDGARLGEIVDSLGPAMVNLDLPRWDIETRLDLGEPLSAMGLPIPGGDLSGIVPEGTIAAAVHAANITVDEHGTEAAAATAIAVEETGAPLEDQVLDITVDRPFLFLVRHVDTGTPLFYGRVTNPAP